MINYISIVLLGFLLGMRHATDPDHVIAVTTIVSRKRGVRQAALIGVLWGIGHTITILLVGSMIILFGIVIPPRIGLAMDISVGLMLILLGILNLSGIINPRHSHPGGLHNEPCGNASDNRASLRPLVVGIVHGLAGSAAVALLVLSTIRAPLWAAAYLFVFGVGTIAGMMLITMAIALPFMYSVRQVAWINSSLGLASGFLSLGFGLFIVYQIGYVKGMFSRHPSWIPH